MSLEALFLRAVASDVDGSFLRVDASHPVELFVGLDENRRAILLVSDDRVGDLPRIAAMHVECRRRARGDWALLIRLERDDLAALFTRVAEDLVEATRGRPSHPGRVVVERLRRWQGLFARGREDLLDDSALRGLMAELHFLVEEVIPARGADAAVEGWGGPLGAPKDFVFGDREIEVKALHRQSRTVAISSLDQLDDQGIPLYLHGVVVELESSEPDASRSVTAWVQRARRAVEGSTSASFGLEAALQAVGWADLPGYDVRIVKIGDRRTFRVSDGFPRIQRRQVPSGVVDGEYRIDLASLTSYEVSSWQGGVDVG